MVEGLLVRVVCFVREFLTRRQCRSESFYSLSQGKVCFYSVLLIIFVSVLAVSWSNVTLVCLVHSINRQFDCDRCKSDVLTSRWRPLLSRLLHREPIEDKLTHGATGRRRRRRNSVRVKVAAQLQPGEHFFPSQIRPKVVFGEPCKVIGLYCVMLRLIAHYSPETTLRYSTSEQCCGCWIGLHPSGSHVSSADHVVASTRQQRRCFIGT